VGRSRGITGLVAAFVTLLAMGAAVAADNQATENLALGLDLAALTTDLRSEYKIKGSVKGVLITGVRGTSDAAVHLTAGESSSRWTKRWSAMPPTSRSASIK